MQYMIGAGLMLIDHIAIVAELGAVWRVPGRFAYPLFLWGVVNGFLCCRVPLRYALRLLVLGLVAQQFFELMTGCQVMNVCFTSSWAVLLLMSGFGRNYWVLAALLVFGLVIPLDYGAPAGLAILGFLFMGAGVGVCWLMALGWLLGSVLVASPVWMSIGALALLVGEMIPYGPMLPKWLRYGFYPVHLGGLVLVRWLVEWF